MRAEGRQLDRRQAKGVLNPCAREPTGAIREGSRRENLDLFLAIKANLERRMGNFLGYDFGR